MCKLIPLKSLINGEVSIGKNVYVGIRDVTIKEGVEIGDYTALNDRIVIHASKDFKVKIGKFCSIADGASFLACSIHNYRCLTTHSNKIKPNNFKPVGGTITIGHDVRIGKNVIVLDGNNIGTGAVIGAGAVVTKDIPPYAIAVGNPAKVIKYRFDDETIKNLLKSERWNWDAEKIKSNYYLEFINNKRYGNKRNVLS